MSNKVEAFVFDRKYPKLLILLKGAQSRGVVIGATEFSVFQSLRNMHLSHPTISVDYLLYGASLEKCVGALAEQIVTDLQPTHVEIDLLRSLSTEEEFDKPSLSIEQRKELLFSSRPTLTEFMSIGLLSLVDK